MTAGAKARFEKPIFDPIQKPAQARKACSTLGSANYFFFIRRYWITDKIVPTKAKPMRTASAGL